MKALSKVTALNRVTANTFTRKVDTAPGLEISKSPQKLSRKNDLKSTASVGSITSMVQQEMNGEECRGSLSDIVYETNATSDVNAMGKSKIRKSEILVYIQNIRPFTNNSIVSVHECDFFNQQTERDDECYDKNRQFRKGSQALMKVESLARNFSFLKEMDIHALLSSSFSRAEAMAESNIMAIVLRNISFDDNFVQHLAAKKLQIWLKMYMPMKLLQRKMKIHDSNSK